MTGKRFPLCDEVSQWPTWQPTRAKPWHLGGRCKPLATCAKSRALAKRGAMTHNAPDTTLDKTFDPARIETKWYAHWENNGLFRPERPDAQPFTIVKHRQTT